MFFVLEEETMRERPPCQVYYNLGAELSDDEEEDADDTMEDGDRSEQTFRAVINDNVSFGEVIDDHRGDRSPRPRHDNCSGVKAGSDPSSDTKVCEPDHHLTRAEFSCDHESVRSYIQEEVWDRGSVPPDIIVSAEKFKIIKDEPKKHQTKVKKKIYAM